MTAIPMPRGKQPPEKLLSDRFYRSPGHSALSGTITDAETEVPPYILGFGEDRGIPLKRKPDKWLLLILFKICQLGHLPTNWNSYGAKPIEFATASFAVEILEDVLLKDDPAPSVVPTSRGGIQFEWHEGGIDLEVDIRSPTDIQLCCDAQGKEVIIENASFDDVREHIGLLRG